LNFESLTYFGEERNCRFSSLNAGEDSFDFPCTQKEQGDLVAMKVLIFMAVGALLSGCAASVPVASETETEQPSQSQVEAAPQTDMQTEAAPETDMPTEEAPETDMPVESAPETDMTSETATARPTASAAPTATATRAPSPVATTTAPATPTPTPTEARLSMANIAKNNSAASCWVAIDGNAYDLTRWISPHPGGTAAISNLCGTDATAMFLGQHGGQGRPSSTLNTYLLGPVAD
jgi:cytochrome b involved in lipid metabolism